LRRLRAKICAAFSYEEETLAERQLIRVEKKDGIVTLYIDRPEKRNAMNPQMHREMHKALSDLRFDPECRVLIITGVGESFSAGQDLKEYFYDLDEKQATVERQKIRAISNEWRNNILRLFPAPTIAAVNGWCFGGAFSIVCSCDIAIAADEATFGLSEINFRAIPGGMVTKNLTETLSLRNGLYYALTGKSFSGKRAAEIGLVTLSVPKARLMDEVYEHAELLKGKDPVALRHTKEAFKLSIRMDHEEAYNYATAKAMESIHEQGEGGMFHGIGGFMKGEFKPGLEHVKQ
jgi:trans-feruloyl-CoA hydratase/vanillin synthase